MNTRDSLKIYMTDISDLGLITVEEEVELANRGLAGDQSAYDSLAKANLRLVIKIAQDYRNLGVPLNDLIAEGNVGLLKAVTRFRPEKGAKFSSYAAWWIKQAIRRALANQGRVVRVPVQATAKLKLINQTIQRMEETLGYKPTNKQLSEELGMTETSIRRTLTTVNARMFFLDAAVGGDDDNSSLGDFISDDKQKTADDLINKVEVNSIVGAAMEAKLSEREILILKLRYGFDEMPPRTLEEVSHIIGRTRERVRQIQGQALRKLRGALSESKIDSPDLCLQTNF